MAAGLRCGIGNIGNRAASRRGAAAGIIGNLGNGKTIA